MQSRINKKKKRHILSKLLKITDKDKIFKAAIGQNVNYGWTEKQKY